ncbi:MAG: efflux RND transporter periplasmic adaptor subunit [Thermodesulfobacteriota bacterium]
MSSANGSDGQKPEKEKRSIIGRLITPLVVVVIVIILGAIVFRGEEEAEKNGDRQQKTRAISVDLSPVVATALRDVVNGVGTLDAIREVRIKPEIHGKLMSINFEEGGFVEKGQVLFEIEDEKITSQYDARKAGLQSARIRLENLRRNYDRVSSLRERNLVSEDQFDNAKTELDAASSDVKRLEAELALAEKQVQDTIIHAPFDGYISRQLVDPGTFVTAGEPLAVVYKIDPLQISFYISEKYAPRVRPGQDIDASVSAYPDRRFRGKVDFISPTADQATRKFRVRANIDNPESKLMPGSFASVQLVLDVREDRPVIPEQALVTTREGYIVYVVDPEEKIAHIREVKTGLREPGRVEVMDGLSTGEQVVVYGHLQLDDGSPVNIVDTWGENWAADLTNTSIVQGG